jgi:hypothetical protein
MKFDRKLVVTALLTLPLVVAAPATQAVTATDKYIDGQGARFESLAGSKENLTSLATGLRTSHQVTLIEQTPTGPKATTFTPATRPMGYGNITRSLDLANRQLAANGITNPTAAQLRAALNGGTITTARGDVKLDGVLRLRSQGMGWGKVAHTIGVSPASGKANAKALSHSAQSGHGVVTAASAGHASPPTRPGHSGIVTAAGSSSLASSARGNGNAFGAGSPGGMSHGGGGGRGGK